MKLLTAGALGLGLAIAPGSVLAQAPPLAAEFQVNTYTTGSQDWPWIAAGGRTGRFVVTWTSVGQDGDGNGIFGQRFDADGAPGGNEFQVNTFSTGAQSYAVVAANAFDNFVVTWDGDGPTEQDDRASCQRFSGGGSKIGGQFDANPTSTNVNGLFPAVATRSSGDFVVVWDPGSGGDFNLLGRVFDNNGIPKGDPFLVNTYSTSSQFAPNVAMNEAGDFVVVLQSFYQLGLAAKSDVFAQRFDSEGSRKGGEIQINTYTTGNQALPHVAINPRGDFVVVWESAGQDGSEYGVFGQRFNAAGEKVGPEFPVNTYTTGRQRDATVAADDRGNFVVVWQSKDQDGSDYGIYGQRFGRSGERIGGEFAVNAYTTGIQIHPRIARTGTGSAIVWMSIGQDGSGAGIVGRAQVLRPEELAVDVHPGAISDANGVLEPGESVLVEPSWRNNGSAPVALTGLGGLTGPPGPTYLLVDGSASYGTPAPGAVASCQDGSFTPCYGVQIGATRPSTHWDAVMQEDLSVGGSQFWTLHVGESFTDVPRSQPFYRKIETMLHNGITSGCGGTKYCPGTVVARDQMAIFIGKGIAGAGELVPTAGKVGANPYACKPGGTSLFADVPPTDSSCRHVHYLAAQNVTLGCGPAQYCPAQAVTRDAMASFIAKAIVAPDGGNAVPQTYGPDPSTGRSYSCNAGTPNLHFSDVGVLHPFCKHIHYLWAKGVVDGCSATQYCPTAPVARDAMAKFIANGFGLQLYAP